MDGLQRLVDFIPSLGASGVKQIVFLHVIPLSGDQAVPRADQAAMDAARDRLAVAKSRAPEGVEVHIEVQCGQPVDRILSTTASYKSDIVLMGTQSRSLLTEKLFGSTTVALCQRTKVPLMVLRPQLLSAYTIEELDLRCRHIFRYFLIPYDGSNVADFLINQIKKTAQTRPPDSLKECLLCWVVVPAGRRSISALMKEEEMKNAEKKLASLKTELEGLDLVVNTRVFYGEPVPEILMAAQDYDISAITIASDSLGKLLELSVPSFAGEIIRRSWHPMIYFPIVKG